MIIDKIKMKYEGKSETYFITPSIILNFFMQVTQSNGCNLKAILLFTKGFSHWIKIFDYIFQFLDLI